MRDAGTSFRRLAAIDPYYRSKGLSE